MWAHCNVYKLTPHNSTLYKLSANSNTKDSVFMKLMFICGLMSFGTDSSACLSLYPYER